ncbi:hypothetical protein C0J52_16447 [Blattella germanica]|nr:hypothetical protein C0J52_16447 [Blattella germanica]
MLKPTLRDAHSPIPNAGNATTLPCTAPSQAPSSKQNSTLPSLATSIASLPKQSTVTEMLTKEEITPLASPLPKNKEQAFMYEESPAPPPNYDTHPLSPGLHQTISPILSSNLHTTYPAEATFVDQGSYSTSVPATVHYTVSVPKFGLSQAPLNFPPPDTIYLKESDFTRQIHHASESPIFQNTNTSIHQIRLPHPETSYMQKTDEPLSQNLPHSISSSAPVKPTICKTKPHNLYSTSRISESVTGTVIPQYLPPALHNHSKPTRTSEEADLNSSIEDLLDPIARSRKPNARLSGKKINPDEVG